MYCAPMWYKSLKIGSYRTELIEVDRKSILKAACAYRMILIKALYAVTGIFPNIS